MRTWILSFILILATQVLGFSQTITASLEGVVHDPTRAVIARATVIITNTDTNVVTELKTDGTGLYLAPSLPAGPYRIEVRAVGFKTAERSGIVLEVNQAARLDWSLELGASAETVEVVAAAPLLDSTSSSVGQVIDNKNIVNLPLNERNSWSLVFLAPGVSGSVGDKYNNVNISINGGRPGSAALMVDGIPAGTPLTNPVQGFTMFPSVDSVQEFKVETNNYSAEFGRSGSGVINLIYKTGTNQLHGSGFEFARNSRLDANDFFSNALNVPLVDFKRNQFGGTVAGPVYLPKLYNGRNKTFFLFGVELLRQASASTLTTTVPTALQRAGDFSQTRAANGTMISIFDPATTTPSGTGFIRTVFPGNVVPASRFDPVSANVVKYYPLPNTGGNPNTGVNNYFVASSAPENITNFDAKVDENVNDHHRFFVRGSRRLDDNIPSDFFPKEVMIAQGGVTTKDTFINAALDYTFTVSPSLIVGLRYGFGRSTETRIPRSNGFNPVPLGFPAYMGQGNALMFPGFTPAGYYGLGNGGASQWGPAGYNTHSIAMNNMKVLSHHLLKFGVDWRIMQANISQGRDFSGGFSFGRPLTQGPNPNQASTTAGDGMASFLLGVGTGTLYLNRMVATQSPYYAVYFADDWKLTDRLTLNIGLRYGLDLPMTERYNRMNFFDPNAPSPLRTAAGLPDLKGGLAFVGQGNLSRTGMTTDYNGWDPRAGFAYQAAKRTVLRGGFGIFHVPSLRGASGNGGSTGYSSITTFTSAPNGVTPVDYLRNPFPGGLVPVTGSADGLNTGVGTAISAALLGDYRVPYTENWSFNIQQQLPGNVLVEVGYVGARGLELPYLSWNMDQLRPEQLSSKLQQQVKNPFYGLITTGVLAAANVPYSALISAYPQYPSVTQMFPAGSTSVYHALQLRAQKRFGSGLSLLLSYSAQKLIDDNSATAVVGSNASPQNIYDMRSERSVSANDVSQVLSLSYVFELPFGKGRRVGGGWNRAIDGVLGGWQINGIGSLATGLPLVITTQNTSGAGNGTLRPNTNGHSAKLDGSVESRLNRYFDTSVFSQPAPFTFGNLGRVLPDVRVPGTKNLDFSLFKSFRVKERLSLQLRGEAFNMTNSPRFGRPNSNLNSPLFGIISGQANDPRQIQFGIKLLF